MKSSVEFSIFTDLLVSEGLLCSQNPEIEENGKKNKYSSQTPYKI